MRVSDLLSEHPPGALKFKVVKQLVRDKRRTLAKPSPELKALHWKLKEHLEEVVGRLSLSPTQNLLAHKRNRYVYQFDLKDAFPSITKVKLGARLYVLDPALGDLEEIIEFVERYCMAPKVGLAQGAPCSSLLFDVVAAFWLDEPIVELLADLECRGFPAITYTRYVDDLTFSSQEEIGPHVRYKLRERVRKAGFAVHPGKTFLTDKTQKPPEITGGKLRHNKTAVRNDRFYQQLERQLDYVKAHGLTSAGMQSLQGRVAWFQELEKRVEGSGRNRIIRRIAKKIAETKTAPGMLPLRKRKQRFFPKEWLERLRKETDIVAYVRMCLRYDWAPKATSIKCPCPFCGPRRQVVVGRRTRQTFTVSPRRRSFHCYNPACKLHGDVIQFARNFFGWEFSTAVLEIARYAEVPLPKDYRPRQQRNHSKSNPGR